MAANETSRVQSIDVLRTLALLCVLSIHSLRAAIAQVNGQDLSGLTGNQIAASCAIGLSTLGVPLFLMISGYLLLDRDYTKERTLAFFKRNLLPLIVSYEIFDLALAVVQYIGAGGVTVADYVKSALFIGPAPMGHLWYMQAIVGAYLLVPLLALLLHAVRERGLEPYAYAVLACLFVCYSVLPSVNQIMALQGNAFQVVSAFGSYVFAAVMRGDCKAMRSRSSALWICSALRNRDSCSTWCSATWCVKASACERTGCGVCGYGGGARGIVRFRRMVESACRRFPVRSGVHAGGVGWVHAVPCRGTGVAR